MKDAHFPMQMVARLTGLSAYVIRIWEQRCRDALEKVGALPIENLAQLGSTLDHLRKPPRKAKR